MEGSCRRGGYCYLVLLRRQSLLLVRDPIMYLMRVSCFVFVSCLFSGLYWNSRQRIQEQYYKTRM